MLIVYRRAKDGDPVVVAVRDPDISSNEPSLVQTVRRSKSGGACIVGIVHDNAIAIRAVIEILHPVEIALTSRPGEIPLVHRGGTTGNCAGVGPAKIGGHAVLFVAFNKKIAHGRRPGYHG